jgi:heptosyltransferase I
VTDAPRHICIVLLTGLGDVVHGLPLVNAFRRAWPEARISWVVEPMPAGILAPHPAIDQVIVFEKKRGARGVAALAARMQQESFDVAFNLNVYSKSVFPTLFSRAGERWTFGRDRAREGVWLAGNRRLPPMPRRHTQDMFLEFTDAVGVEARPLEWRLRPTADELQKQRTKLEQLDGMRIVAIAPVSANAKKDWPAERYVDVVNAVQNDMRARVLLVGGPGERDAAAARIIAERASIAPVNMLGDDVRRLIWTIDASAALIAPDTGPVHIARALGVPVVGLYGHTNPWRVGPYRAFEDLWVDAYTDGDPDPSNAEPKLGRMERIDARTVIERVERALATPRLVTS